jgi:hypothetical protein
MRWPDGLAFWAVFVWAFAPEFRIVSGRDEPLAAPHDKGSKGLIVVGQGLAAMAAGAIARFVPSAGTLLFFGIGLALGNWIGLLVLIVTVMAVYGHRVSVEERALATTIGDPYRAYMRHTKRFVPFFF